MSNPPSATAAANAASARALAGDHRYRCYLATSLQPAETGVRPFVQLKAASASLAARLAIAVTGALAVVEVVRLEEVAS